MGTPYGLATRAQQQPTAGSTPQPASAAALHGAAYFVFPHMSFLTLMHACHLGTLPPNLATEDLYGARSAGRLPMNMSM